MEARRKCKTAGGRGWALIEATKGLRRYVGSSASSRGEMGLTCTGEVEWAIEEESGEQAKARFL